MGYRLYVFLRSDLESLTPGKAAAQVAHAASQAAWQMIDQFSEYTEWANEPSKEHGDRPHYSGFGTTLVLDAGSFVDTFDINSIHYPFKLDMSFLQYGVVRDPTYPLRDGKKTHLIDITTCYWVLEDPKKNTEFGDWVKQFDLYTNNHD